MRKDVEYKLKDGRTYVAHYDRNSVCKVRKATLELLFKELDISYEQAKILEKIKENYALFRATANKWIPVGERLPEKNVEVLATTEWGAVTIAEMYSANDWLIHEGTTNADTDEIVAWMPLPKPYKAESEDKE